MNQPANDSINSYIKMSAPNAGRQSPDPETQTGSQKAPPASDPNEQGQADHDSEPAEQSKDKLKDLESNPEHILAGEAEKKTSKTVQ